MSARSSRWAALGTMPPARPTPGGSRRGTRVRWWWAPHWVRARGRQGHPRSSGGGSRAWVLGHEDSERGGCAARASELGWAAIRGQGSAVPGQRARRRAPRRDRADWRGRFLAALRARVEKNDATCSGVNSCQPFMWALDRSRSREAGRQSSKCRCLRYGRIRRITANEAPAVGPPRSASADSRRARRRRLDLGDEQAR